MSVFYTVHQDKSTGTKRSGKWYARAKNVSTLRTRDIARLVERNATAKESDVKAVIREMVDVLQRQCQEGKRVVIEGLGWFKIGIESKGALTAKDFNARENVTGAHIIFQPETETVDNGGRVKKLLQGATMGDVETVFGLKESGQPEGGGDEGDGD
jgi:predicted histone-like DNA-binding protein